MNKVNTKYQILLPYLIKYFPSFSIGLVFLLLTNAIGLYIPSQLEKAVDLISQSKDSVISPIEGVLLNILLAAIILALVRTLSRLFIFYAARNIEYDLRRDLFSHLLEVDMKFHHQKGVGDMMSRFTNDLGQVRLLLGPGLLNMINSGVVFLGALSLMFWQSPRLLAYSLLPYLPAIILIRWVSLQLYRRNLAVVTFLGKMNDFLQQVLTSLFVVHSYVREPNFYRQFNQLSFELFHKNMALARLRLFFFPLMVSVTGFGMAMILWKGGALVANGEMSMGGYVRFTSYYAMLAWPTVAFGWVLSIWQRGLAGLSRLNEVFKVPSEERFNINNSQFKTAQKTDLTTGLSAPSSLENVDIALQDLKLFSYSKPINATIQSGKTVVIVGPTGGGKTWLLESIMLLTPYHSGQIKINSRDCSQMSPKAVRDFFAYVPQEAFLFSQSVRKNIEFGQKDEHNQERNYQWAAELADISKEIESLPLQFNTLVGERGITMSGGQRQRIALARALFSGAPYLMLDDCLSALDLETESHIITGLKRVLSSENSSCKGAIIVTQRLSMVELADQVWLINQGSLEAIGTHQQLLAENKLYRKLVKLQSLKRYPD